MIIQSIAKSLTRLDEYQHGWLAWQNAGAAIPYGDGLAVSTHEKVRFLGTSEAYPSCPEDVTVKETHMSWVFIAGDRVYKLKKPVHYPFLDFRTLAAREQNCREEVRLNRRLAPEVYLGVVPLTQTPDGRQALSGAGEVVDWLVEMRRLPDACLLDQAIRNRAVQADQIKGVARLLVDFYRTCPAAGIAPNAYIEQFARESAINEAVFRDARFELSPREIDGPLQAVERGLNAGATLLEERVKQGRVVEGHGDLRPEHVCLTEPPVIIDCLEFSRALRLVDPFDELAFLGLECELLSAGWIGDLLLKECAEGLGDHPPENLIAFYWAYRACLRARLALVHLLEPEPREAEKWLPLARRYLALAEKRLVSPVLRAGP